MLTLFWFLLGQNWVYLLLYTVFLCDLNSNERSRIFSKCCFLCERNQYFSNYQSQHLEILEKWLTSKSAVRMSYCNFHCWLSFPLHWIPTLSMSQKSQKCTKDCGTVVKAAAFWLQPWLTSCSTDFPPEGDQLHLNSSALGKSDRY